MRTRRRIPRETVPATECCQQVSAETAECPVCQKAFRGGSIVTDKAVEFDPAIGSHFRLRKLFCDHCTHIVYWLQACTADGRLVPQLLGGPGFYRSPARIEKFLAEHPEAAGVEQNV